MTTNQINSYGASAASAGSKDVKTKKSTLDSQDFLQLLAAQMSNQDVMNPTDNTEYVAQLAQFTSLQEMTKLAETGASQLEAINSLSQVSYTQFGASMVGKNVIVATTDEAGKYAEDKGIVTNVNFTGGTCTLSVNGKKYALSSVMDVYTDSVKTNTPTTPEATPEVNP